MSLKTSMGEALTGLRRNASMTVALVVTLTVSLMLVAFGLLISQQVDRTEHYVGDRLQITVYMCTEHSTAPTCIGGADGRATPEQIDAVVDVLDAHEEVASFERRTQEDNYVIADVLAERTEALRRGFDQTVDGPEDMFESFLVTLVDPTEFAGLVEDLADMPGVDNIGDWREQVGALYTVLDRMQWVAIGAAILLTLAAVFQVSNMIRMTAYARRREINIMRLVGASQWHIQWPFILEAIVAALVSAALACGALALFMHYVVFGQLHDSFSQTTTWVGWSEAFVVMGYTAGLAVLLAVPTTLFATRRYIDV